MKRKQIIPVIMFAAVILTLATSALGTKTLAADANDVMARLNSLAARYPKNAQLAKAVDDAGHWLSAPANAAKVDDTAARTVLSQISAAETTIGRTNQLSELSDAQINGVIANIGTTANAVGLSVRVSANLSTIALLDSDGNQITGVSTGLNVGSGGGGGGDNRANNPIKQTGFEPAMYGIIAFGIVVIGLTGISLIAYLPKKRLPARASIAANENA